MFIITKQDPFSKVKIQEKLVTETIEKRVVDSAFLKLLTADQLEQLCTSN